METITGTFRKVQEDELDELLISLEDEPDITSEDYGEMEDVIYPEHPDGLYTGEELYDLRTKELQEICRKQGLSCDSPKTWLCKRLLDPYNKKHQKVYDGSNNPKERVQALLERVKKMGYKFKTVSWRGETLSMCAMGAIDKGYIQMDDSKGLDQIVLTVTCAAVALQSL